MKPIQKIEGMTNGVAVGQQQNTGLSDISAQVQQYQQFLGEPCPRPGPVFLKPLADRWETRKGPDIDAHACGWSCLPCLCRVVLPLETSSEMPLFHQYRVFLWWTPDRMTACMVHLKP
jgi:hypothetical protein